MKDAERFRELSPGVYLSLDGIADAQAVAFIRDRASSSPRGRCRICFHGTVRSPAQEMLIAVHRASYIRPHRHLSRTETLTVLDGLATSLRFDGDGTVTGKLPLGPHGSGRSFFYRMPEKVFHALLPESDWLICLETTSGPFDPNLSEAAPWSPPEDTPEDGLAYLAALCRD